MHHGIEGQKWGVRRYQNPDGSLTPLGRQHYGLNKLDYDSKFEGTRGEGRRAYKKERKQLMGNLKSARNSIDNEIKEYASDSGAQALRNDSSTKSYVKEIEKRLGTKISDVDDPELYDLIAQDMEAEGMKVPKGVLDKVKNSSGFDEQYYNSQSAIADKTYQKGQKEVDNYLSGKYGEEIISSYNKGKKAKTIAIGAGVVAGSAILGVGLVMAYKYRHPAWEKDNEESPDLDETLRSEAKKRGISDEEFNKITKPNSAQKERSNSSRKEKDADTVKILTNNFDVNEKWEDKPYMRESIASLAYTGRENLGDMKAAVSYLTKVKNYDLFEPHNGKKLASETKPKEEWDDDTFTRAVFNLKNNFSKENYEDLDRISEQVYRKKR